MEKIETFTIATNDENWIRKQILDFNVNYSATFNLEEMLYDEVVFAKISTKDNLEILFEFIKFVSGQQAKEYIEGKI
jgi:hypothetical protein